jgi:hypothetical protein
VPGARTPLGRFNLAPTQRALSTRGRDDSTQLLARLMRASPDELDDMPRRAAVDDLEAVTGEPLVQVPDSRRLLPTACQVDFQKTSSSPAAPLTGRPRSATGTVVPGSIAFSPSRTLITSDSGSTMERISTREDTDLVPVQARARPPGRGGEDAESASEHGPNPSRRHDQGPDAHPALFANTGNGSSRADPARGSRKLPQVPAPYQQQKRVHPSTCSSAERLFPDDRRNVDHRPQSSTRSRKDLTKS